MSKWDDRLLEFIKENGSGAPTEISNADYMPISKQYISKRLKILSENNLLESLGNGVYQISKEGLMYLYGDYDAESGEILVDIENELEELNNQLKRRQKSNEENIKSAYLSKLNSQEYDEKLNVYANNFKQNQ